MSASVGIGKSRSGSVGSGRRPSRATAESIPHRRFLQTERYTPPEWAKRLSPVPDRRLALATLPTPIHPWRLPGLPSDVEVWIKRDDMTGDLLGGNKARKLEFFMADALKQESDCVITVGDPQSNHCTATAVPARYLGMDVYLIYTPYDQDMDKDPAPIGNQLIMQLVGSHISKVQSSVETSLIHLVTQVPVSEFEDRGQYVFLDRLEKELRDKGRRPYVIPLGGTNALGTWGYLECMNEIMHQLPSPERFTDIIVACGSGSTVGGLALGITLNGWNTCLHSYGTVDTPEIFYAEVKKLFEDLGVDYLLESRPIESYFEGKQARGRGHTISTPEELRLIKEISRETGVILDPVYTGKAVFNFYREVKENPRRWSNRRVLFIHTGGLLGLYDKAEELLPFAKAEERLHAVHLD